MVRDRKNDSLAVIAEKIIARRAELGAGEWLSEEVVVALEELGGLMSRAELEFEEIRGGKPSVIIRSTNHRQAAAEAYSLRMMANSLANPANNILSQTLNPECRAARKELVDNLRRLYVILLKPGMLEEAKRWEKHSGQADRQSTRANAVAPRANDHRSRLLLSVREMGAVDKLYREDQESFNRLFDPIWEQVRAGTLSDNAAPGKLLDRVRSSNRGLGRAGLGESSSDEVRAGLAEGLDAPHALPSQSGTSAKCPSRDRRSTVDPMKRTGRRQVSGQSQSHHRR